MDTQVLLETLNRILSATDNDVRKQAEHNVGLMSHQPNFVLSLATITTSQEGQIPVHLRQLAGVLLRTHVSHYWSPDEEDEHVQQQQQQVQISEQERQILKQNLPRTLGDASTKISTIVSMIIAEIASHDFPEQWPDLITVLIQQFESAGNNEKMAYGSLKCLSLVAEHFSDHQVGVLFPNLFPYAMKVAESANVHVLVRSKALSIASQLIQLLGMMRLEFEKESDAMVSPLLPNTLNVILPILMQPVASVEADCSLKMEALKVISSITRFFSKKISTFLPQILQSVMKSLVSEYDVFVKSLVMSSSDIDKKYDSEGDRIDFDTLVCQLLELVSTLIGKNVLKGFVSDKNNAAYLLYLLIGYTQMTVEQQELFEDDPNQFVYDNESFSIRSSALLAISELMKLHKTQVSGPLIESSQKHMMESAKFFQERHEFWWKPREACFSILESLSKFFSTSPQFDIVGFLASLLKNDLATNAPVFLKARAIELSSKFFKILSPELRSEFFQVYIAHSSSGIPLPIRLYSTLAIARFIGMPADDATKQQKHAIVQPFIRNIVVNSCEVMREASDDNIHIPLDTLAALIHFRPDCISHIGKDIISLLLDLCAKFASDPSVPMDIVNVFQQMAKSRPNYEVLRDALVPQLAHILSGPAVTTQQSFVQILIDILTVILNNATEQDVPMLLSYCFRPIVTLILDNDDPSLLNNASECLRAYIYIGSEQIITYQYSLNENGQAVQRAPLQYIFQVIAKLLHPELPDDSSSGAGGLINALFTTVGTHLNSDVMATIIKAAVHRLAITEKLFIIQSLVIVFAKLVHDHMDALLNLLSSYELTTNSSKLSSLLLLLQKWGENQSHFFGNYRLKVTTLALAKLLLSGDQRLALNIQLDSADTEQTYRTRSKGPIKKRTIMFPIQAFLLVIEGYFRAKEAREFEEKGGDLEDLLYASDEDDDFDDEDLDDEEEGDMPTFAHADDELNYFKHLVSNAHIDDEDEDDIEDVFEKRDPINKLDLEQVLPATIKQIIEKYPHILPVAEPFMTEKHKEFIKQLLASQ